jgi:hypothetical protein
LASLVFIASSAATRHHSNTSSSRSFCFNSMTHSRCYRIVFKQRTGPAGVSKSRPTVIPPTFFRTMMDNSDPSSIVAVASMLGCGSCENRASRMACNSWSEAGQFLARRVLILLLFTARRVSLETKGAMSCRPNKGGPLTYRW